MKTVTVSLTPHEVEVVLDRLCIRFGFCLPPAEIERLAENPPTNVDEFTAAVFDAEGYGFTKSEPLCAAATELVAQAFLDHVALHQE